MPYASRDDVKAILLIPSSDTRDDVEIDSILNVVHAEVEAMLMKYTDEVPENDDVLKMYEAMWAAGLYRMRREKLNEPHPFIRFAIERIEKYIQSKFAGKLLIG